MPEESIDNKKLYPILKDAYDLLALIENQEKQCRKKIRQLEEFKQKLKDKQANMA